MKVTDQPIQSDNCDHEPLGQGNVDACPCLSELDRSSNRSPQPTQIEPWHPTESQRKGIAKLHQLASVFLKTGDSKFAGFRPACQKVLAIGASGSGKTALVLRFAAELEVPLMALDCGSWLVAGAAAKPPTLGLVRDYIRATPQGGGLDGIIFMDEVCKLVPSGGEVSKTGWSLSVAAEAISLLSADSRLSIHGFTSSDIWRLKNNFMIIGGGAFQNALREVEAASKKGELGFSSASKSRPSHCQAVNDYLPEEILSRFSSDVIVLDSPGRADFEQAIQRIHSQLGIPRQRPLPELVDQALKGLGGMRWVENYLCGLLSAYPYAIRNCQRQDHRSTAQAKARVYEVVQDLTQCQKDANEGGTKLQSKLVLLYSRLQSISSKGKDLPVGGLFCNPRLGESLEGAIAACNSLSQISSDDSAHEALALWRDIAWQVIGESSAFLETHDLSDLWAEAWTLTGALIVFRQKLLAAVERGQIG